MFVWNHKWVINFLFSPQWSTCQNNASSLPSKCIVNTGHKTKPEHAIQQLIILWDAFIHYLSGWQKPTLLRPSSGSHSRFSQSFKKLRTAKNFFGKVLLHLFSIWKHWQIEKMQHSHYFQNETSAKLLFPWFPSIPPWLWSSLNTSSSKKYGFYLNQGKKRFLGIPGHSWCVVFPLLAIFW